MQNYFRKQIATKLFWQKKSSQVAHTYPFYIIWMNIFTMTCLTIRSRQKLKKLKEIFFQKTNNYLALKEIVYLELLFSLGTRYLICLLFSTDSNLLYLLDHPFCFNFPKPFGLMKLSFQKVPNLVFVALRTKRRRGEGLMTPTLPPLVSCVQEHYFDSKNSKI